MISVVLSAVGVSCPVATRAGERPTVEIALARAEVFAGEDPGLTITVTAPAGGAIQVVKANRAHVGHLAIDVVEPDGRRVAVGGGVPFGLPPAKEDGYERLGAGKSVTLRRGLGYRPVEAGEHAIEVEFRPTPDPDYTVKKSLKLVNRALTRKHILAEAEAALPDDPDDDRPRPTVDLLVVQDGPERVLMHRCVEPEGQYLLRRLWPVTNPVGLLAEVADTPAARLNGTIRVSYREGGKPVVAEVEYRFGGVVKPPPPAADPKGPAKAPDKK